MGTCPNLQFDEAQWIIRIRRILDEEEVEVHDSQPISIFDVPKPLLRTKPEAYTPQLVALGPYHHRREELRDMEMYKLSAARRAQALLPAGMNFQHLVAVFSTLQYQIRAHYHRHLGIGNDALAWMMAIDVSFLLEFLQTFCPSDGQRAVPQRIPSRMSHVVDPCRRTSSHGMVLHDVVMLENQVPLFLLLRAMEMRSSSRAAAESALGSMVSGFFQEVSSLVGAGSPCTDMSRYAHLLDFLYSNTAPPCHVEEGFDDATEEQEQQEQEEDGDGSHRCRRRQMKSTLVSVTELLVKRGGELLSLLIGFSARILLRLAVSIPCVSAIARHVEQLNSPRQPPARGGDPGFEGSGDKSRSPLVEEIAVPSVAELAYSGVRFVPASGGVSAVEFCADAATLRLPVIRVDANTEVVLRNMVAYEASAGRGALVLARYVELMNGIVDIDEDARVLRESGVILNHLKSDGEVAELWNGMARSVRLTRVAALDAVIDDLNRHHDGCWKVRISRFLRQKVVGSRELVVCVAMVVLVVFMSLQAFCVARRCMPPSYGMARTKGDSDHLTG